MVGPAPLASGRDADVFVVGQRRVLRRYRNGGEVAAEARVMAHVAAFGFSVPAVYEAHGTDLVMEQLDGPTMLSAIIAGHLSVTQAAFRLADLHHWLHEIPARLSHDADIRILHMDLHPDNVMLTAHGPVVIDWRNATEGRADLDVAMTAVILAQVAVDETHPLAAPAGELLTAFLDYVGGDPLSVLNDAVAVRRADPALTRKEVERLDAAAAAVARR